MSAEKEEYKLGDLAALFIKNLNLVRDSSIESFEFATGMDYYPDTVAGLMKLAARKYKHGTKNSRRTRG